MSSNEIAIRVEDLSKCYYIYEKPQDRLKQSFFPYLQKFIGYPTKQYFHDFWALKNISFDIGKGETVGIIGRNGSGKSTLLQLICGTLTPTHGTVTTSGRIAALLELGSGFNPEFTGRENVYLNGAILGLSKSEIERRFSDIAVFADIGEFIDQPVKTYSSGMVVRLAFAVAINVEPHILVVDEALSVGDELFQRKCFAQIELIKKSGATVLFVSHSASAVIQLCDRAILLEKGEKYLDGNPRYVTKQYHRLMFSKNADRDQLLNSMRSSLPGNNGKSEKEDIASASFVNDMASVSQLSYSQNGGEIVRFEIQDTNERRVNLIPAGFIGIVKVWVRFDRSFEDVVFGFHIKSVSGLELAGLSFPTPQDEFVQVDAGDVAEVCWHVKFAFLPGTYFLTFGVRSNSDETFINRVVDGLAVKIVEKINSPAFGLFDISTDQGSELKFIHQGYQYD
jgi:homopolymeric O-antigen transport system ATP-binding protein